MNTTKRKAFFISDGTGITAEALGQSLLAQFDQIQFDRVTLPYIDSVEKAEQVVEQVAEAAQNGNEKPIIFDTIVNDSIREVIAKCDGFMVDIFSTFLSPLETELGISSSYSVGKSHAIDDNSHYPARIAAMHYALDNDDGGMTREYEDADIILVGVSRCGKTPTCIYLALQFGIKAANYPITDDDLDESSIPKVLKPYKKKIFGLTIDPTRLQAIRQERRPDSRYSSTRQCQMEVREAESIFRREGVPFLDTTHHSVEEISTRILAEKGIQRHI